MTKKIPLATLLFFAVWFINSACKKNTTTTGGSPAVSSNTISTVGDPSGTFSGIFIESSAAYGNTVVLLYNTPISVRLSTGNPPTPTGTVSTIYCNYSLFSFNPTNFYYTDPITSPLYMPATWSVTCNANFPSFTYTSTTAMPSYTFGGLPNTISRSQNLTLSTAGGLNYDQMIINISDGMGHTTSNLAAGVNMASLVCLKDSLLKLNPTTSGNMSVTLYKYSPQVIGNKNYLFVTTNICNATLTIQ